MGLFTKTESSITYTVLKIKEEKLNPVTVYTFADEESQQFFENLFAFARIRGHAVKEEMITEANYRVIYSANNQYKSNLLTRDVYLGFTNKDGKFLIDYKPIEEFVKYMDKIYKFNVSVQLV